MILPISCRVICKAPSPVEYDLISAALFDISADRARLTDEDDSARRIPCVIGVLSSSQLR
jgi:hypothetical protein